MRETLEIEHIILRNLVHNEIYMRKVLPYLKKSYFTDDSDRFLFRVIESFVGKYNNSPTISVLQIAVQQSSKLGEAATAKAIQTIDEITVEATEEATQEWLVDTTEEFCRDQALFGALLESIQIKDGNSEKDRHAIPEILTNALQVSFDTDIGHDYLDDADKRYEFYHGKEKRIPFHLSLFNRITGGGVPPKTLNVAMSGTGVGKSLFMCDWAANLLTMNYNVAYITMEIAEERISERIDANLMDRTIDEVRELPKIIFDKQIDRMRTKYTGKLKVKEYPTASAHAGHFRYLLDEWAIKKNFHPDILFVDYMNICSSARLRGGSVSSYEYVKSIAEELRGLAVEKNIPVVTATQLNRVGFASSDVDMTNVSESFGTPASADLFFAIQTSDELEQLGQFAIKQLKNRYADLATFKRFVIGVNRPKMKLYDVENQAQTLADSGTGLPNGTASQAPERFNGIQM